MSALGSFIGAGFLCELMARFEGNERFQGRVEFMEMARALFSRRVYLAVFALFLFNLTTSNISAIVEAVQTLDRSLLTMGGRTCGLGLYPEFGIVCISSAPATSDSVYGDGVWVVSLGFILLAILSIPIGFWNLEENMWIQLFSCAALITLLLEFLAQFLYSGLHPEYVPASSMSGGGVGASLGSILFNFAFVVTVPSWVNEKRRNVSIHSSLMSSMSLGVILFIIMGLLGGMAYRFPRGADLLTKLSYRDQWTLTQVFAQSFPPLVLVPGIPILSIIVRYNLLENKVCGPILANFLGVILPWAAALVLLSGNLINVLLNWSGLLTIVPLNVLIPCIMLIMAQRRQSESYVVTLEESQRRQQLANEGVKNLSSSYRDSFRRSGRSQRDDKERVPLQQASRSGKNVHFRDYNSFADQGQDSPPWDGSEEDDPWRLFPFLSEQGNELVAKGVCVVVGGLNILAIALALFDGGAEASAMQDPGRA